MDIVPAAATTSPASALPVPVPLPLAPLAPDDEAALEAAVDALENLSLAARLSNAVGRQISVFGRLIPPPVTSLVNQAAEMAMRAALHVALRSLTRKPGRHSRRLHKAMAALSGAAGGAFGLSSIALELPISTTIMLRSIADIARDEGEDLSDPEAALACLEVFALGGERQSPLGESGYFAIRGLFAKSVSEAARYLVSKTVVDESAPALLRLIGQISARFGVLVSQKVAAQSVPLIGAAGGAAVNYAFTQHFQSLAQGHFTIRRLERLYGAESIRLAYERIAGHARAMRAV